MQNTKIKKTALIATTAIITIISLIEINRKHEYKLIAQSADALEIQIKDDGLWTSKDEIKTASTQVNNAINELYVEAIEAGINVEATIQGASSQAEAIYLVQGALKATEQQNIEANETLPETETEETIETPAEAEPETEDNQNDEVPPVEEEVVEQQPAIEEEPPVEEEIVQEQPPVEEEKPTVDTPPVVETIAPTINNFAVVQTSSAPEVNVSFDVTTNDNEIKKVTLKVENETGATKTADLEITPDNIYDINISLPEGNYNFSIIVEYIDAQTNEALKIETDIINLDVITNYFLNLVVAQGQNEGEIILDFSKSILPDSFILYDVYVDGEIHEKNMRTNETIITLSNISSGEHEYQVVAKYLTNREIKEIHSEIVTFSTISEPTISNFIINQNSDPNTNEIVVDISFDLKENENIITNISATATNIETQEVYNLSEIEIIIDEEETISYVNVAPTILPQATYNFDLVVEYQNGEEINKVTSTVENCELIIVDQQPETNDRKEKIRTKIESL